MADNTHDFHRTKHNYLSYSQLADWLGCNYRWSLRYYHGLHPKKTARPLALGDCVHQCIAATLLDPGVEPITTAGRWLDERSSPFEDDAEGMAELIAIADTAHQLASRVLSEMDELGWEPVMLDGRKSVEFDLVVPIPDFDGFIIHVDYLAYDRPNNLLRLVDYKVRRTFMPDESEFTNLQHAIYHAVCRRYGIPVAGSVTYQLRSELPKVPKLNKGGTMSRTAIATDWNTYRKALEDAGLDPGDYEDMEGKLAGYEFTRPQHSYRSPDELDRIWDTIVLPVSRQIAAERQRLTDPDHVPVRNLRWVSCQTCQFREACLQGLAGYDIGPLLTTLFEGAS